MARALLIVNPSAGTSRSRRRLARALREAHESDLRVLETPSADAGREAARQAAEEGVEIVIAAGGDGTVHSIVSGLLEVGKSPSERPRLAFLPAGRGNDLARSCGTPRDPARALRLALRGDNERMLDVGEVVLDGQRFLFVNALGIGFDASVARHAQALPLAGFGAYLLAIVRVLVSREWPWHLVGRLDGSPFDQSVTLFSIGNGRTTGGGFQLTPSAIPWDGLLDYCCAEELSRVAVLGILPRLPSGRHAGHPRLRLGTFERFEADLQPPAPIHADGEILSVGAKSLRVGVLKAALRVRVDAK